jgi:outer membrane protein assembly factor BamE (lipoprotein component of BamABCDE complex)
MERSKGPSFTFLTGMLAVLSAAVALGACSSRIDQRGNLPDPELLANVEVGHINKQGVQDMLGTPSSIALFDQETWFYISQRTEKVAFFDPTVIDRKVIVIKFDPKGVVTEMKQLGLEDSQDVQIVERKTPTAGQEMSVLKQLLGNIGRFGPASRGGSTGGE